MKEYYSIGEFSRLFGINIQTLYYYDQIGLLKPKRRRGQSGRRDYAFDQVYTLASIRFMRRLDFSIEQIHAFLSTSGFEQSLDSLRAHSAHMREKWAELLLIDSILQRKLRYIEERIRDPHGDDLVIRQFPERRYIPLGDEEGLFHHDSFYYYPTIAFYQNGIKSFGAYLEEPFNDYTKGEARIDVRQLRVIPAGSYLCTWHHGAYSEVEAHEAQIRASRPDLALSDQLINFNIIDQFVESNQENYITEMQIPLLQPLTDPSTALNPPKQR